MKKQNIIILVVSILSIGWLFNSAKESLEIDLKYANLSISSLESDSFLIPAIYNLYFSFLIYSILKLIVVDGNCFYEK